ncbi:calexcitin-2-like [Paramacrobiotus metropolitanus]|uniref:calexcitin-2-like n=1 Tax=Paramacrobiotus metropolitanus TaxID=2943436 RepID=UPI0024462771|nr:calexcitin-2-like [Paramacrobiotus metropolitanus]
MAAVSDFQKKKLLHLFNTFFDCNKNGTIERKDFDMALERVASLRQVSQGSGKYREVEESLNYVWEHLKKVADRDNDGNVSQQEWLKMWEEAITSQQEPQWVKRYQDFLFEVEDVSGDGKVDEKEFVAAYTQFGIGQDECRGAFKKLTNGTGGEISKADFEKRFREFILSNEPSAPGNYLLGKSTF